MEIKIQNTSGVCWILRQEKGNAICFVMRTVPTEISQLMTEKLVYGRVSKESGIYDGCLEGRCEEADQDVWLLTFISIILRFCIKNSYSQTNLDSD